MRDTTAEQLQRIASVPGNSWTGPRQLKGPPSAQLVLLEIRAARARLLMADANLTWVDQLLRDGNVSPAGALEELDRTMTEFDASL